MTSSRFFRLGRWCATHRTLTIVAWVLAAVAVSFFSSSIAAKEISSNRLPGTETERVYDLLAS